MNYQCIKKIQIMLMLFIAFATLPALKSSAVSAGHEKAAETIKSELPEMDFTAAYEDFNKKEFGPSSREIKKGAEYIRAASEHSGGKIMEDLLSSYKELEKLSGDIKNGAPVTPSRLRKAFSHAHQALAEYYLAGLKDSWQKKDMQNAGRELKSAALHLERSIKWAGIGIELKTEAVLKDARLLSEKLLRKAELKAKEVEKGIKDMGEELSKQKDRNTRGEKSKE